MLRGKEGEYIKSLMNVYRTFESYQRIVYLMCAHYLPFFLGEGSYAFPSLACGLRSAWSLVYLMLRKLSPLCDLAHLPFSFSGLVVLIEFFLIDFNLLSVAGECHDTVACRFSENFVIQPLMRLFVN